MFRNYFKTGWRNLVKNKFYSVINIAGLTIGLTIGLLILLWVQDEFSYDSFHKNSPDIIRLENMVATGVNRQLWTVTAAPIGYLAKKEIPGVKDFVRISDDNYYGLYKYNEKVFDNEKTFFTDPTFFSVFDFNIVQGNAANPFPDNNSIVITESTAKKYFDNNDAIGKIITADDSIQFRVAGVVKDFPKNSSIQGNIIFPISLLAQKLYTGRTDGRNLQNDFHQFGYETYLLLQPRFSFDGFAKKLRDMHLAIKPDDTDIGYVWLPLEKMHLYSADGKDGGMSAVRMFMIIAMLVLLIACINYVNLSTARSMLRAKEVTMRKIIGAAKWQLFLQFIVETIIMFAFVTACTIVLVYVLVPYFNQVSGKEIVFNLADVHVWEVILVTITATLIISSIYPALLLSSFEPIKALRGKISAGIDKVLFRKVLVVIQFSFSIILITGTIIIGNQLQYMRSEKLGYDKENVLSFNMINMSRHFDVIKAALLKQPGISNVTWATSSLLDNGQQTGNNSWDGKEEGATMMLTPWGVDQNFISFFNMQMAEGSNFTGSVTDSTHYILNETAVRTANIKDPIGKKFSLWGRDGTIAGVVKDFHFASMQKEIQPAIFYYQPNARGRMFIKTNGKDAPKAIAAAEQEWKKYNADFSFDYAFLNDSYDKLYKSEERTGTLFNLFSVFAIFISCLGLLGLATYTAQIRTKEIGVRKVLGASVPGIIKLLTKDFVVLVLIAIGIATPIAWFAMSKWLQNYAYKINIGWPVFVIAGVLAIGIAILTISFQAIKAAIANPVKSLRTE